MATVCAEPRAVKPSVSSFIAATEAGLAGSVMSITCTPSSPALATTAYVLLDMSCTAMPCGLPSSVNPPASSRMLEICKVSAGSVMSTISTAETHALVRNA